MNRAAITLDWRDAGSLICVDLEVGTIRGVLERTVLVSGMRVAATVRLDSASRALLRVPGPLAQGGHSLSCRSPVVIVIDRLRTVNVSQFRGNEGIRPR